MCYPRIATLTLLLSISAVAAAAPLPATEYTGPSKFDNLVISPGGTLLAVTQREGEKQLLTIVEFPSMKSRRSIGFDKNIDIDEIEWVDEKHLLIQPARRDASLEIYKVSTGEIMRVDVDTGKTEMVYNWLIQLMQRSTPRTGRRETPRLPAQILDARTGDSSEVLIQTVGGIMGEGDTNGVYRMNVQTGALKQVASSPLRSARFVEGAGHGISLVYGQRDNRDLVTYHLEDMPAPGRSVRDWQEKVVTGPKSQEFYPVAWTGRDELYYVLDNRDAPTLGVFEWDARTNAQKLLYRNPEADMHLAARDPGGKAWLFRGDDGYPVYWYPDPEHPLARLHRTLAQQMQHYVINVTSSTDDLSVAVVRISSGARPPTFLVVDVRTGKPLQVMPTRPALKDSDMAPVSAVEFVARDGLRIGGYLTTPLVAGKPGRNLPMVVMIHGGPYGIADDFGYDFKRQLFASRGYAVLQVNFRGSGDRGRVFEQAGYREWGRAMQDDVTDAVRSAIKDGVADAARICIYGGSYGAYSALMGVVREPDLFKCAIGMSGVYDLPLMFGKGDIRMMQSGRAYLDEALGNDTQDLKSRSPVYYAKDIKAKVMLLHGLNDQRAPFAHAEKMRKALIEAGNPPEWVADSGEAHGIFEESNRAEAYTKILDFLERNIGH
jgi:dipeptidyl aminopeptidase/acylaminoacyl peptidase